MIHVQISSHESSDTKVIIVTGEYGFGGSGNDDANYIYDYIIDYLNTDNPKHIILDLSQMHYAFGNRIANLFINLGNEDIEYTLSGECRAAYESLFNFLGPNIRDAITEKVKYQ
jgi:hypothetical protein